MFSLQHNETQRLQHGPSLQQLHAKATTDGNNTKSTTTTNATTLYYKHNNISESKVNSNEAKTALTIDDIFNSLPSTYEIDDPIQLNSSYIQTEEVTSVPQYSTTRTYNSYYKSDLQKQTKHLETLAHVTNTVQIKNNKSNETNILFVDTLDTPVQVVNNRTTGHEFLRDQLRILASARRNLSTDESFQQNIFSANNTIKDILRNNTATSEGVCIIKYIMLTKLYFLKY